MEYLVTIEHFCSNTWTCAEVDQPSMPARWGLCLSFSADLQSPPCLHGLALLSVYLASWKPSSCSSFPSQFYITHSKWREKATFSSFNGLRRLPPALLCDSTSLNQSWLFTESHADLSLGYMTIFLTNKWQEGWSYADGDGAQRIKTLLWSWDWSQYHPNHEVAV